jgi:CHAT domain-containing protein/tetratricopeptide (TPR) repeat protein
MFRSIVFASLILLLSVSASAGPAGSADVTLPNAPGALHLLLFDADRSQMAPNTASILDQYDAHLTQKLLTLFPGATITAASLINTEPATIAQACAQNQAIGVVVTGSDWPTPSAGAVSTISATVVVGIYDCYGEVDYASKHSIDAKPSTADHSVGQQQISSTLDDLGDQAVAEIHDQAAKLSPTRLENFLKYGYAIGSGERRPYFGLEPDPSGARVTYAFAFGSAGRAGLKPGDLVTSINGRATMGLSQDQLNSTLLSLASPPNTYALKVRSADGSKTTVSFAAQDIQWYLTHPGVVAASASPTPSSEQSPDPVVAQMETLIRTGDVANSNGDATTALSKYEEVLALARQTGNRGYEARALGSIGAADLTVGRYADALSNFQPALSIARQLGMRDAEAAVLANMGIVFKDTGRYDDALANAQQALAIDKQLNRTDNEERVLGNIADVEERMGRYDDSLEASNAELAIAVQRQDVEDEAGAHLSMGNVMTALSRFPEALRFYRLALDAYRELKNPQGQAHVLGNIGIIQLVVGQYADALESQTESIALAQQANDPVTQAKSLNDIANVQAQLGLYQAALQSNSEALEVQRKIGDPARIATSLTTRGFIEKDVAAYAEAESYFRQALAASTQIGDQSEVGYCLNGLGAVQAAQGQYAAALASYQSALAVFVKLGDLEDQAELLWSTAAVQQQLHLYHDALESAQRSIALHRATGSPAWHGLATAARAQASLDDTQKALANYEAAIAEIEQLRGALPEAGSRTSFFEQALPVYDDYIAYLLDLDRRFPGKGYDRKAFEVFERRQARTLLEEISQTAAHDFSGVPREVSDQESTIATEIAHLKKSLAQARSTSRTDATAIAALEAELRTVQQRQGALEARIRSGYPAYYTLQHPSPISVPTLQEHVLRPGEAMLVYDVLSSRTALWIVTPTSFRLFELEGGTAEVQSKVGQFLSAIQSVQSAIDSGVSASAVRRLAVQTLPPFVDASSALYQSLVPPAARETIAASNSLYVVPTGALYGTPFEALVTQGAGSESVRYLIEDHSISYLSSASLLAVLRTGLEKRNRGTQQPLVAFANPVFDETATAAPGAAPTLATLQTRAVSRIVTRGAQSTTFPSLPGSEVEAKDVAATIHGAPADVYVGDEASVATVHRLNTNGSLANFRYVLFATHAALPDTVSGIAQPSLVLAHPAGGGFLTMGDVFGLSLNAQLVMLSACESGGGITTRGEGVQGLTQAFMYAGTPVVSVTQWEVVDNVAERFTPDFFLRMHNGATPAQALRAAKLAMVHGSDAMLRHPFFWAPTVIFGDGALAASR